MNRFGKIADVSGMTPEQLAKAHRMAEFLNGPNGQRVFTTVALAERLLPSFLSLEHSPSVAAQCALSAAIVMHKAGEDWMQKEFDNWCADKELANKQKEAADKELNDKLIKSMSDAKTFEQGQEPATPVDLTDAEFSEVKGADVIASTGDRDTDTAPADHVVNADAAALEDSPVEGHVVKEETISRDQAIADTAERVAAGEPVSQTGSTLPVGS